MIHISWIKSRAEFPSSGGKGEGAKISRMELSFVKMKHVRLYRAGFLMFTRQVELELSARPVLNFSRSRFDL